MTDQQRIAEIAARMEAATNGVKYALNTHLCDISYLLTQLDERDREIKLLRAAQEKKEIVMREILFRGKRIDNGEWVEGLLLRDCNGRHYITACDFTPMKRGLETKTTLPTGCLHRDFWVLQVDIPVFEVDPATVGQYTGLTDKNGKRIFEGDIIECWSQGVKAQGDVRQRLDGLWIIYPAFQSNVFWGLCPQGNGTTAVEVIGNIHEAALDGNEQP